MKNKGNVCFGCLLLLLFTSCNECRNDECPAGVAFTFVVADSTGKSLIPRSRYVQDYLSDSVYVTGIVGEDEGVAIDLKTLDRRLYFWPEIDIHQYIISYSFADDDTLEMDVNITAPTACCPSIVEDYRVTINGENPGSSNTVYVLKKQ